MKTPKINREEVRTETFVIPMTKAEKQKIKNAADKIGIPMSSFARYVFFDYIKTHLGE